MLRCAPLALALLLVVAAAPRAAAELEGSYWMFGISGTAAVGIDGLEGTDFDVEEDFGYEDDEAAGATLVIGSVVQVGASYLQLSSSGQQRIDRTIKFRELTLPVSADVSSEFDYDAVRGFLRLNLDTDVVRGGLVGGIQYMQLEGRASAPRVGRATAEAEAPMPVVGAYVRLSPIERLQVHAQALGMSWEFDEVDATYFEAEAAARLYLTPNLYLGGGYRHIAVDVTDKSEVLEVDLEFAGPVAYAGLDW